MIIFTFGVSDRGVATIRPDKNGQPNFHVDGNCNVLGNIDLGGQKPLPVLMYGPNADQPPIDIPEKPTLIFNQISEADSHATALQRCSEFCARLPDIPVINHPNAVQDTARDAVYRKLQDIPGVKFPKTVRCVPESPEHVFELIESEELQLPVILRTTGDHNAWNMIRIDGHTDQEKLHAFAFDGTDHYLIEFIDTADDRNIYTKYRILMVDGNPFSRHVLFGPDWAVNSKSYRYMSANPEMGNAVQLLEDLDAGKLPKAKPALKEIAKRMKLDYFAVDCHMDEDGQLLVFEANASTFALSDTVPVLSPRVKKIRGIVRQMMDRRTGFAPTATFHYTTPIQI